MARQTAFKIQRYKTYLQVLDSGYIYFGDDKDANLYADNAGVKLTGTLSQVGALTIGVSGAGYDVTFYGDTVGCNFLWDQNGDTNGSLILGADTKATFFYAYGATTGNYLKWDAANDDLLLVGTASQLGIAGTTAASSATTGSIHTAGGIGIAGALWVGTTSRLVGAITADATLGIAGLVTSTSVTGFRSNATFVPDENRTNYAYCVGNRVSALTVTIGAAATQHLDPFQLKILVAGVNPGGSSTLNGFYQLITHSTAMANMRLKNADWNIVMSANILDAYCYQGELDFTSSMTVGGEAAVLGLVANASAAVTGNIRGAIISMQGTGTYATAVGLEIRTTCGTGLGSGLSEGIRIAGTPLPVVGIAMGNQTNDNEGPQNAFFFPSIGGADEGPCVASGTATGAITIKIGTATRYIRFWETA